MTRVDISRGLVKQIWLLHLNSVARIEGNGISLSVSFSNTSHCPVLAMVVSKTIKLVLFTDINTYDYLFTFLLTCKQFSCFWSLFQVAYGKIITLIAIFRKSYNHVALQTAYTHTHTHTYTHTHTHTHNLHTYTHNIHSQNKE